MNLEHLAVGNLECIVEVTLDAEAMRGRPGYRSGVRPNHWMPGQAYAFVGQLDFLDRDWLRPGESCEAKGRFRIAEQDRSEFVPGFTWDIGEARRIVGRCKLLRLE